MAKPKVYLIGHKRMNHVVSNQRGVKKRLVREAREIAAIAEARLARAKHRTGQSRIEVSQGDVDAFVSLVDPAALSIEFGHYMGSESLGTSRKFIPGFHLFLEWYHDGL